MLKQSRNGILLGTRFSPFLCSFEVYQYVSYSRRKSCRNIMAVPVKAAAIHGTTTMISPGLQRLSSNRCIRPAAMLMDVPITDDVTPGCVKAHPARRNCRCCGAIRSPARPQTGRHHFEQMLIRRRYRRYRQTMKPARRGASALAGRARRHPRRRNDTIGPRHVFDPPANFRISRNHSARSISATTQAWAGAGREAVWPCPPAGVQAAVLHCGHQRHCCR